MFEKIPFVLGWSADARIGRFKVKLSRLTTHEESAASDGGSYNATLLKRKARPCLTL
jgi:hypothetical protein